MPRDIRTRSRSADTKRAGSGARAENRASRNIWKSNQSQSGRRPSAQIPGPACMPLVSLEFLTKSLENFHNLSRALSSSTGTGGGFSGGGGGGGYRPARAHYDQHPEHCTDGTAGVDGTPGARPGGHRPTGP